MVIEKRNTATGIEAWQITDGERRYWVRLRRTEYGPVWDASVFVEPRSDQKPYWRNLRNWQRFACLVREFENAT